MPLGQQFFSCSKLKPYLSPKFLDKNFFGKNGGETYGKVQLGSVSGLFLPLAIVRAYIGSHLGCQGVTGCKSFKCPSSALVLGVPGRNHYIVGPFFTKRCSFASKRSKIRIFLPYSDFTPKNSILPCGRNVAPFFNR